ncbi:MAG TPA: hypothetical protein VGL95_13055 [Acetobacteraceae bacterium]|jgi:hypothetical protein
MAIHRLPRPRDPLQLGKLIVDIATGQVVDEVDDGKNAAAAELGRIGGLKGGKARAKKLTAARRSEIARAAAKARHAEKT